MGKNFIEINGKKYDAVTGKQIVSTQPSVSTTRVSVQPKQNVGIVDGFVKPKNSAHRTPSAANHASKSPQKSQTLARKAVLKPSSSQARIEKPFILKSHLGASRRRELQAKTVSKSQQIHKFENTSARTSIVKSHTVVPVRPEPTQASHQNASQEIPQQLSHSHGRSIAAEKMIEAALANAQSHNEQPPVHHRKKRRSKLAKKLGVSSKMASVGMATLAIVLLAGFFAVQNVPNLAMRVAATRAGFNASMPGYQPSGFSFRGPISYSSGQVTVSYRSNTDERAYDVTQKSSNWNSEALLSNYVLEKNKQYQTYVDRGRTLYIYDESNATWVDNGIWYQIEGDSDMTTDQLIRIASSI